MKNFWSVFRRILWRTCIAFGIGVVISQIIIYCTAGISILELLISFFIVCIFYFTIVLLITFVLLLFYTFEKKEKKDVSKIHMF